MQVFSRESIGGAAHDVAAGVGHDAPSERNDEITVVYDERGRVTRRVQATAPRWETRVYHFAEAGAAE